MGRCKTRSGVALISRYQYIIFEAGSPEAVSKMKNKKLTYAIAVAGDLRNKCYQLQISWAGADNVDANRVTKVVDELEWNTTVAGGENSYTQNMMLTGTESPVLTPVGQELCRPSSTIAKPLPTK